ncbi:MAG: NAD-dependent succinate-semialdehyde dehydrogenase [Hyphomicrobiales bacterium]|nr:NAD-dependent succinate-semialdehyde dehydrogenase [Hyphomicrobiales bacterium]MDE2016358.1 NAD-dependent succinate-semialdehyde dehydrogenase [Hyphomicrobiales bacterium]
MNEKPRDLPATRTLMLKDRSLLEFRAYVGGEWVGPGAGGAITVADPADGAIIGHVPNLGPAEARRAIAAAKEAMRGWAARPAKERAGVLRKWFDLIVANADDLAQILTAEQGKPLAEARAEVLMNAGYVEWFAEEAKRLYGDVIPAAAPGQRILVFKRPVGVCAAITPWNFPNGMITRKAGPALAAGCSLVLKPASQTPLSALSLAVLAERAGVPKGVFSVVTGDAKPIGEEFCANPDVAKITFTGSTAVGRWLMERSAHDIKRLSLELGGNAPFLVFDDADLDAAADGAVASKFRNAGQTCVCANRIYVQESVAAAFVEKLAARVAKLKIGRGTEAGVTIGPLIDERAVAKMEDHLKDALGKGAKLVAGGRRSDLGGTFYEPTIVTGVTQAMKVAHEETFAPLAPVVTFKDEAEAIAFANDSEFGLASYFYARDLGRVFRVAEAIEAGMVAVNTPALANEAAPFGGVKRSGLGREGSKYGIEGYVEIKYVNIGGL